MRSKSRSAVFYQVPTSGKEPAREWLKSLKDKTGRVRILGRIRQAEKGNFGDHKNLGQGVGELRIPYGPGYRVYYGIDFNGDLIILLIVGRKSTQSRDINTAKQYWQNYKKEK